jgi:hypothetical protein
LEFVGGQGVVEGPDCEGVIGVELTFKIRAEEVFHDLSDALRARLHGAGGFDEEEKTMGRGGGLGGQAESQECETKGGKCVGG